MEFNHSAEISSSGWNFVKVMNFYHKDESSSILCQLNTGMKITHFNWNLSIPSNMWWLRQYFFTVEKLVDGVTYMFVIMKFLIRDLSNNWEYEYTNVMMTYIYLKIPQCREDASIYW